MLILIVAGGPDKGRIYELLDGKPVVLGREGDQVSLNDRKVSREHARLWCEGAQWYLEDLGSRHGTFRNHTKLEENQKAKLKDGDYIQIGNTVMVMARMSAEIAERAALLDGNPRAGSLGGKRRTGVLVAAGLTATAALIGLGAYLVFELQNLKNQTVSREQFAQVQSALEESQRNQLTRSQADGLERALSDRAATERRITGEQQRLAQSLDNTSDAIQRHNDAIASASDDIRNAAQPIAQGLAEVREASEQQRLALATLSESLATDRAEDNSQQVLAQLDAIKTQLAGLPSSEALLEQLESAIAVNAEATGEAVSRALADAQANDAQLAAAERTEALVVRVLGELEKLPTAEDIAANVRVAVNEGQAANEEFMRQVLVELRRTGDQITTDVAAAIDQDAGYARALMDQVVAELGKQPTGEQLAAELRVAMSEVLDNDDTQQPDREELVALMRQVLTELEQRPTTEQLAADLRLIVGSDAQRTEQLMTRILAELDSRPTAGQIANELRSVDNEAAVRTAALLDQVLARMEDQQQLAAQIDELRKTIEGQPQNDAQLSRQVMQRLDEQARNNDQIVTMIAELRDAMPEDVGGQLNEVLARLDDQARQDQLNAAIETAVARVAAAEDRAVLAAIDSMSAKIAALPSPEQLEEVIDSQQALGELLDATDTRAAISELRASLDRLAQARPQGPGDDRLARIIEMLEKREQADLLLAEMHDMLERQPEEAERMRRQVLTAIEEAGQGDTDLLLQELLDEVRTRLASDEAVREAIQTELNGNVLPRNRGLQDAHDISSSNPPAATSDPGVATAAQPASRLTKLEQAYKESFETNRPVTVGAGTVDPTNGRVSEGRRIDPSVAKALGFETWRDWYLADAHADRVRRQQDAQRDRNQRDAEQGPADFVTLPGVVDDEASEPNTAAPQETAE